MSPPFFTLRRLRVLRRGAAVYDQKFHDGVNIIRGENGSGKSTIADFIFYALGGEFDSWKSAASQCEEVQAEILTRGGVITVRRAIGTKTTPPVLLFGPMAEAEQRGLDGWERYPLHRTGSQLSFSQVIFRASGIPEAQSAGASNITMHQILRIAYSDQRTPASRLFRFESFDNHDIREAVGNLVCGLNVYESYEIQLKLRELGKQFDEKQEQLSLRLAAIPPEEGSATAAAIDARIKQTTEERVALSREIAEVDTLVKRDETKAFLDERQKALEQSNRQRRAIREAESESEKLELELADLARYVVFLNELIEKLPQAEAASRIIGNIEFTHCPSCLARLADLADKSRCTVCGSPLDSEKEGSRYLQIKLDLDIQLRESLQLRDDKSFAQEKCRAELRKLRKDYDDLLNDFAIRYDLSSSPRESFLAQRNLRIGRLGRELEYLSRLRETAAQIGILSEEKAEIQKQIEMLKDRQTGLARQGEKRRAQALTLVSSIARRLLRSDLPRQPEFADPGNVTLSFRDDAILVDGAMNFAESSNVILKNTAVLSLFSAAVADEEFYHPRFLLLDNVEDKGMEVARSHNFQSLIVQEARAAVVPHQIIFTTSMINPELETDEFVIGPRYTHENRTLSLPRSIEPPTVPVPPINTPRTPVTA